MDQNHLNNFERGPTKDHSCEVWSKSNQWFRRRCCLKIVDGQTDIRTTTTTVSDHNSSPWAFSSGELKRKKIIKSCMVSKKVCHHSQFYAWKINFCHKMLKILGVPQNNLKPSMTIMSIQITKNIYGHCRIRLLFAFNYLVVLKNISLIIL